MSTLLVDLPKIYRSQKTVLSQSFDFVPKFSDSNGPTLTSLSLFIFFSVVF